MSRIAVDFSSMTKVQLVERLKFLESARSVESSVAAVVAKVAGDGVTEADLARAEMAMTLAKELDSPSSERPAPAAVSKELRGLLDSLEKFCREDNREGLFS